MHIHVCVLYLYVFLCFFFDSFSPDSLLLSCYYGLFVKNLSFGRFNSGLFDFILFSFLLSFTFLDAYLYCNVKERERKKGCEFGLVGGI